MSYKYITTNVSRDLRNLNSCARSLEDIIQRKFKLLEGVPNFLSSDKVLKKYDLLIKVLADLHELNRDICRVWHELAFFYRDTCAPGASFKPYNVDRLVEFLEDRRWFENRQRQLEDRYSMI